jgi:hypothetical protein
MDDDFAQKQAMAAMEKLADAEAAFNKTVDGWTLVNIKRLLRSFDRGNIGTDSTLETIEQYEAKGLPYGDTFGDLVAWIDEQDEDAEDAEDAEDEPADEYAEAFDSDEDNTPES